MKKSIILTTLVALIMIMSTTVFASSSIAEQIYEKGKNYGVTQEDKNRMEKYFSNNELTEEQVNFVLGKADEVIKIMDDAGVKDVTKLSTDKINQVKTLVQEAANHIGLTVSFHSDNRGFTVLKNGKAIDEIIPENRDLLGDTGSNTLSVIMVSLSAMAVAGFAVAKLRKNA